MAELDGCEYHAAQYAVERTQEAMSRLGGVQMGTALFQQYQQATETRRISAEGCRKCNLMLDVCTNPCDMPTKTIERAQSGQTTLTRSVQSGRPTKVIKHAHELRDGELSPCHAANTSRDLQRVQNSVYTKQLHGIDPTTMRQFNSAKEQETIANNGCRKCNPYLTRCTNENCDIPTPEVQRQKGYAR